MFERYPAASQGACDLRPPSPQPACDFPWFLEGQAACFCLFCSEQPLAVAFLCLLFDSNKPGGALGLLQDPGSKAHLKGSFFSWL